MNIGIQIGTITVTLGALFGGGWLYNRYVAQQEEAGREEGFTALFVVCGVLGTLVGVTIMRGVVFLMGLHISHPRDAFVLVGALFLLDLLAFAASGFWMVWGSWQRYARRRENAQNFHRHAHD